jgi:1,4-dihydroxy-2-naphthoate octaprenyltransferase
MVTAAFAFVLFGVIVGFLPPSVLIMFLAAPLAAYTIVFLFKHYSERDLIKANSNTIMVHLLFGLLLTVGLYLSVITLPFLG